MLDMQKRVREYTLEELDAFGKEREIMIAGELLGGEAPHIHAGRYTTTERNTEYGYDTCLFDIDKDFPIPNKAREEARAVAKAAVDEYVRQGGKREDVCRQDD